MTRVAAIMNDNDDDDDDDNDDNYQTSITP